MIRNRIDHSSEMPLYSTSLRLWLASEKYANVTRPVVAMPTERIDAPRPYEAFAFADTLRRLRAPCYGDVTFTSSIVHGNGERASTTSPCRDSSAAKLRLDQWFTWPGVFPRSRR